MKPETSTHLMELKAAKAAEGTFTGYGSVFGNMDLERDIIAAGAFEGRVKETTDGKLRIALYHDLTRLAGKADYNMSEEGLEIKGALSLAVSYVQDSYQLMLDKVLDAMSIGFNILPGGSQWEKDEEGDYRIITKGELWEVSLVPFGMNPQALVDSVKTREVVNDKRALEHHLRGTGFSRREARALMSGGFAALQRDAAGLTIDLSDSDQDASAMLAAFSSALKTFNLNQ